MELTLASLATPLASVALRPQTLEVQETVETSAMLGPSGPINCQPMIRSPIDRPGGSQSLNSDPFNLRAEEMAMDDCCLGLEVRRTWSEQELVRSFGGRMPPGTPDGMFETWDGTLTCVQVVRVPLVEGTEIDSLQHTLTQTILCKIVKSQTWLRFSSVSPHEFIIFCWLPFGVPDVVMAQVEMLMSRVRLIDHRFVARLRLPAEPGKIFPALFACNHDILSTRSRSLSESDLSTFVECEGCGEEEEFCEWDITWDWEAEEPMADPVQKEETEEVERTASGSSETSSGASPAISVIQSMSDVSQVCDVHEADQFQYELQLSWDDNG
eukprot:Skav224655  [mRNA]  locus=scaffold4300:159714:160691:- [translate_table: standard]